MEKAWFTAECIYSLLHAQPAPASSLTAEARYFPIEAFSEEEAKEKALILAKQREHSYKNRNDDLVQWRFDRIGRVVALFDRELREGSEVFYTYIHNKKIELSPRQTSLQR